MQTSFFLSTSVWNEVVAFAILPVVDIGDTAIREQIINVIC